MEVCREANLSEVTFPRWKNQFGQMEVSEAKRLKELERNTELKKMLAESLLKNRVLGRCAKKYKPGTATAGRSGGDSRPAAFRAGGVPVFKGVRSIYWYRSKEPTSQEQRLLKG